MRLGAGRRSLVVVVGREVLEASRGRAQLLLVAPVAAHARHALPPVLVAHPRHLPAVAARPHQPPPRLELLEKRAEHGLRAAVGAPARRLDLVPDQKIRVVPRAAAPPRASDKVDVPAARAARRGLEGAHKLDPLVPRTVVGASLLSSHDFAHEALHLERLHLRHRLLQRLPANKRREARAGWYSCLVACRGVLEARSRGCCGGDRAPHSARGRRRSPRRPRARVRRAPPRRAAPRSSRRGRRSRPKCRGTAGRP